MSSRSASQAPLVLLGLMVLGSMDFTSGYTCPDYGDCDRDAFEAFKRDYNKTYENGIVEERRFAVYKENLNRISEMNIRTGQTAIFDVNQFADLSASEFKEIYGGCSFEENDVEEISDSDSESAEAPKPEPPAEFDWRKKGIMTPVKNQGGCGSCYAFATVGALEAQLARRGYGKLNISEQFIVDCDKKNHGCGGGKTNSSFHLLQEKGYYLENDYPYIEKEGKCKMDKVLLHPSHITKIVTYPRKGDEKRMRNFLIEKGPFAFGVLVPVEELQFYQSGVINSVATHCGDKGHSMLMAGYGTEDGMDYWLAKNSWGTGGKYGDGYLKFERGVKLCKLGSYTSLRVPVVKHKN